MTFFVYIVASQRNGTIYIGSTDDIARRVHGHKTKLRPGFASRHGCDRLVWYEAHESRETAFERERNLKEWRRSWKLMLIEERSPEWDDLYESLNC